MQIWAHKPKWVQMNILPFLPDQTTKQPWMHPAPEQNNLCLVFWDAHPKISKCHQNLLKLRVIVNKNPNRKFSMSTISNKSENVQNNILSIFTWHHFCPPPSSETPIFVVRKQGGHLINSQVDTLLIFYRAKGGDLPISQGLYIYTHTCIYIPFYPSVPIILRESADIVSIFTSCSNSQMALL